MEIKYGIKSLVEESYKFNYDFNYSDMTHNEVGFQIGHSLQLNKTDDEIIELLRKKKRNESLDDFFEQKFHEIND